MAKVDKKRKIKEADNPRLTKINLKSEYEISEFAENIINTVREPLLLLDKELRVVKASRSFFNFFKVTSEETIGTLIYDLGNRQWNIPKLRELLETILPKKTTFDNYEVEHDFSTIGKRIMLLNARQIQKGFGGKEQIILLAIEDITERKGIETGLEKTRKELVVIKESADEISEFAENIINTVREPLLLLDKELRVVKASRSFFDFFKVNSDETIGTLIYDLGNQQWNIPKLRELLETILPEKTSFDNYEVEHDFSTIGKRIMLLNARKIQRGSEKEQIILLAIEDITERKQIETGLEKTRKELVVIKESADEVSELSENIINTVREPLLLLDKELRVVKASRSFYEFFKVNSDETIGTLIYDLGNNQWNIPKLRELLETILPEKTSFDNYEVEHDFSTIGKRIMLLNARKIQRGSEKEQIILLAIEDITERKGIETGLEKTRKELVVIKESADEVSEFAENIINTVREPLLLLDKELRVVKASRSFYDFFKVSSDETIGTLIYDLGNHQWDILKLRELLETILPEKTTFDNYEVEHDFSTIGKRIMLLNARQIQRSLGKEKIILLAIEDITERKKIEDGLERTRKELVIIKKTADEASEFAESVINTVREPLIALDQDLRVVKPNRSFYEFFKVSPEETVGELIYDLGNHQWDIPKLRELLETILPQKATFDNYEVEHDFSTIGKRIMLLNARQIQRGFGGKEKIILLAIEDITERKEIETGLEKTRKELAVIKKSADEVSEFAENIINTVREPLLVLDKDLRVVKASRSFFDFFMVTPDETIGNLIYDLGNNQWNIPKLRELLETILPEKTTFDNYEVEHDFYTIGKRIMLLNARKIQRGSGKEQIILLAIEDITERKKIENELTKAKAEAERANVAKSEFLSRMSHELRTPMNSILGFAQLMDMDNLNPVHKKGVNQILTSGKHLLALINEVLDMARIESGRLTVSSEPVEIFSIILETIDIVHHLVEENQITIESDALVDKRLFVKADRQRLKQVLLNLINNAVKYNRKFGSVKIVCSKSKSSQSGEPGADIEDNVIRISVIDTGKGIAQEYINILFNPFERIGAERTVTEGTGLGLAISKKLIEAMGGIIGVESEVGKGSSFWIELPQVESQKDRYERISELVTPPEEKAQDSGTILYIEDNLSNIQLVEQILDMHRPSINLITNIYGNNAVKFAIDYKPDLILLDLDLPDIHGSKVIKLLKEEPKTSKIPVIILSADAMTKQIEQLMEAGAIDYLIKPIDVLQFLKIVDEWMKKST